MSGGQINTQERVMHALRGLYQSYGYQPFKVNKFEEYDLYAQNKKFLTCQQVLTFSDTDGRLMALKPDVTLSIVKNTTDAPGLRKVFYNETVYRVPGDGEGFREIPQTGLECIGALDGYAVGEVVMLAARSLETISSRYVLDVSHVGVVSGILAAAGVGQEGHARIFEAVAARNTHALRGLCAELGVSPEQTALLQQLVSLYGPLDEMLRAVEPLPLPAESRAAVQELRALAGQLALYGLDTVRLDFSLVNDVDYYNGIVFRGFLDGVAAGVLSGGRYDRLMTRMGKRGGAIGFAVYLDRLERFQEERAAYDVDTLVVYTADSDVPLAIRTAEALVRRGAAVRVERAAPAGLTFRQKLTVRGGEVTEDA